MARPAAAARPTRGRGVTSAQALESFDLAAFAQQHPTVVAAIADYFGPGRTVDDLFRDCLEVVIAGAAAKAGATS